MKNRGFIFTMDAILGLIPLFIILGMVSSIGIGGPVFVQRQSMVLGHLADDSLATLEKLGTLDTMATMYANYTWLNSVDNPLPNATLSLAEQQRLISLIDSTFEPLIPSDLGYRITMSNDLIVDGGGTNNRPELANATVSTVSTRVISGFEEEAPVLGCVANARLEKIVSKSTTKLIDMPLSWGSYGSSSSATVEKQFELPDDANITSARMFYAPDTDGTNFFIYLNGNDILDNSIYTITDRFGDPESAHQGQGGNVYSVEVPPGYLQTGTNNMTFTWSGSDMGHFHPGNWLEVVYNTSVAESEIQGQKNFYGTRVIGEPAANQIIPFIVDGDISNIFIHVNLTGVEKFVLITGNYRYDPADPTDNVIVYRLLNQTDNYLDPGNTDNDWGFPIPVPGQSDTIEYNITITATGTTIEEALNGGFKSTVTNSNITLSDFFNDQSNTLAIYTDVDAPNDATGGGDCGSGARDWEKLGQHEWGSSLSDSEESGSATSTAEIFSDEFNDSDSSTYVKVTYSPRQSIGFNFISISEVYEFPGAPDNSVCSASGSEGGSGSMAQITFTTPTYDPIEVQLFASQRWGGCDNGYNMVWVDNAKVMDTDTPPGTATFLPPSSFANGTSVQINVTDKDSGRRILCGNRSKIYYTYRVPIQVGFGETFDTCKGSTHKFYYDGDQDGIQDGDITPAFGPVPSDGLGYNPCVDGADDALWRLLDSLNFINDNVDGGDACDDATPFTNVTSDGNITNPFDLKIDVNELRFTGLSAENIPFMYGPLVFTIELWGET